jgi:hypothetical protein
VNPNVIRLIRLLAASVGPFETCAWCHARSGHANDQRATKRTDLDRAGLVLKVAAEPVDELDREVRVAMVVDRTHDFFRVPCRAHLPARVAGGEEPEQFRATVLVEAFIGLGEQASAPIQRVGLAPR